MVKEKDNDQFDLMLGSKGGEKGAWDWPCLHII